MTLNLGEEVPVPSTTFTPVAQGGAAFNPLTSFSYRPVGVNVEITPRVTYEGDITLELLVENSSLGKGLNVAGQSLPSFNSRKVADQAAAARRRIEPARRTAAGRGAPVAARIPGHPPAADHQAAAVVERQHDRPDRHRDAADAAHRAHARALAAGRQPDLRRHAAEPRARRARRRSSSRKCRCPRRPGPPGRAPSPAGAGQAARRPSRRRRRRGADARGARGRQPRRDPGAHARRARRLGRRPDRRVAAVGRAPCRRWALHAADLGDRRLAPVVDVADRHLQPRRRARAHGAGGQLHALGRRAGELHQPRRRERRPRGHRHRASG